jgi:hypothetical protein
MNPVAAANQVAGVIPELSREERREAVVRVLSSPTFRGAPLLQRFLEFTCSKVEDGRPEELGEYVIATQVFGRPENFDPAADTIVRTQAYRLRTKLKHYYENEGSSDPVLIDIPKGHYVPCFSFRAPPLQDSPAGTELPSSVLTPTKRPGGVSALQRYGRLLLSSALLGFVLLVFLAGAYWGRKWKEPKVSRPAQTLPEPVRAFWGAFLTGDDLIIAYTNSIFFETESGDLLRFRGGAVADRGAIVSKDVSRTSALSPALVEHAGELYYEDGFTGVGEVLAVSRLTQVFAALGINVVVKRSRLVSAEDFRNHDVIFLGSPYENQVLAEMRLPQRFTFDLPQSQPYLWAGWIADTKAERSAPSAYKVERDPKRQVLTADYALFNVLPGPAPGRRVVVLAGLTTSGTQGAAEFATSSSGLQRVRESLGIPTPGGKRFPEYFESLLRVEAVNGLDALTVKYILGSHVQRND